MNRYRLAELQAMPTIEQGQTDDLKMVIPGSTLFDHGTLKVWLSRMTKEDGEPYDNKVTIEEFWPDSGQWTTLYTYPAI